MPFGNQESADHLAIVAVAAAAALLCSATARAQDTYLRPRTSSQQSSSTPQPPPSSVDHLHGVVINSLDGKPVPRVLVTTMGNQGLAVLTDYEGRFSFDLRRELPQANPPPDPLTGLSGSAQTTTLPFSLRKPGYTSTTETAVLARFTPSGPEPEVRLAITPAGLISGHITSTGSLPPFLNIQLRRKQIQEGTGVYSVMASSQVDPSGNYRFPELTPGDYKISTQAYTENGASRSPRTSPPDSLPGVLPTAYPDLTSIDSAAAIHIGPGAIAIADLNLRSAPFYRVIVPMTPEEGAGTMAALSPETPGLMLSYNPRLGAVVGYLPDGSYTVHLRSTGRSPGSQRNVAVQMRGAPAMIYPNQQNTSFTGTLALQVADAPVKTDPVVLHPGSNIVVNVDREFEPDQSRASVDRFITLPNGQQMANPLTAQVTLNLVPVDPGNGFAGATSSMPEADGQVHIPNVSEGVYRVRAFPVQGGYVAAISCGAADLLREPLVVGPSGVTAPIEVTLRNDAASLKLNLDDSTLPGEVSAPGPVPILFASVHVIPLDAPQAQALLGVQMVHVPPAPPLGGAMGHFDNLAPGRYLILAIRTNLNPLMQLEYNDPKVREALLAKGTIITLSPNQKAEVRVPVLPPEPQN